MRLITAIMLALSSRPPVIAESVEQWQDVTVAPQSAPRYIFVCDDNDLANICRNPPYNFNCTLEGWANSDVPIPICKDETKCSCELQSPAIGP
ncbi:hypothetical protein ISF_01091 [Cordyceps fumosorosea ARSEF 2679]|uniref:Uncharacterized protein n=1 Tax=Cordyceps fumosorosea (strain ARSEF 2679) TaxID=1081104 RepID=A0A168ET94_CORFA|nr:hypothetical protein ISF_01091 [Cordyceps fumosorosea ARSEF 2679]OAA74190.1 hypothetical protein ISF_01091 [Cordyceps fumosorosea ARSEF 2679]